MGEIREAVDRINARIKQQRLELEAEGRNAGNVRAYAEAVDHRNDELEARVRELEKRAQAVVRVHDLLYGPDGTELIACRCPYCKAGMRELRVALAEEDKTSG